MLQELNTYDWEEAFKYADSFTRDDVREIYGIVEGENDGDPWRVYGRLLDGRYFYLEAGCDYTGWDCQASGSSSISSTRQGIIRNGLTEEARRLFGLVEDNVGTIEIKEPKEVGFTKITREKKGKKETREKDKPQKKRLNNSILGLEIE